MTTLYGGASQYGAGTGVHSMALGEPAPTPFFGSGLLALAGGVTGGGGGYIPGGTTYNTANPTTNINKTETYAPEINQTTNYNTRTASTIPGLPPLPGIPQVPALMPLDAPNMLSPYQPVTAMSAIYPQAQSVAQPAMPDFAPRNYAPQYITPQAAQADLDALIAQPVQRQQQRQDFGVPSMDDTPANGGPQPAPAPGQPLPARMAPMAPTAPPPRTNTTADEAMREYWNNPARTQFDPQQPEPRQFNPYMPPQRPAYQPVTRRPSFWEAAMTGTPGARQMYIARRKAEADARATQYEQDSQNYRTEVGAFVELAKAGMNQKTQGAMTMNQGMDLYEKISKMPPGPLKNDAAIQAAIVGQVSGLPVDFTRLLDLPQDPVAAANQFTAVQDAIMKGVAATKATQTAVGDINATNASNAQTVDKYADYNRTREAGIAREYAQTDKAIADARVAEGTADTQIAQAQGNLQKTQQSVAQDALIQARQYKDSAADIGSKAAMLPSGPLKERLLKDAEELQAMGDTLLGRQQAQFNMPAFPQGDQTIDSLREQIAATKNPAQRQALNKQLGAYMQQEYPQLFAQRTALAQKQQQANQPRYGAVENFQRVAAPPPPMAAGVSTQATIPPGSNAPRANQMVPPPPAIAGVPAPPPSRPAVPQGLQPAPLPTQMPTPPRPGAPLVDQRVVQSFITMAAMQSPQSTPDELAQRAREMATAAGWTIPQVTTPAKTKTAKTTPDGRYITPYGMPTYGLIGNPNVAQR
jgi:hypothetical protein